MKLKLIVACVIVVATACSKPQHKEPTNDRILAMSFPGGPNPPTKNLISVGGDLSQFELNSSEEDMLTKALLRCGIRQLSWTSMATDGGSRLIVADNETSRSAIRCVAKTFPLRFYVVPERASESDLKTLTQLSP